jgi:hypothetical protein
MVQPSREKSFGDLLAGLLIDSARPPAAARPMAAAADADSHGPMDQPKKD